MMRPHVIVVGAGAGGLSAAIALAAADVSVTLLESANVAGGKIGAIELGSRVVDTGPTVLTMPWVFEELFRRADRSLADYVTLQTCPIVARHAWPDGTRLDLHADVERSVVAIAEVFGTREADAYRRFVASSRATYEVVEGPFLRSQRPTAGDLFRHATTLGRHVAKVDSLRTMWRSLEQTFDDPRLRQLFGRYATYCGGSPFEAPATFNLVAHVESCGVHAVRGGMRALAVALRNLARELGVAFRFDTTVAKVVHDKGGVRGVVTHAGQSIDADAVVWSGDIAAVGHALTGGGPSRVRAPASTSSADRSLSAVTWAVVGKTAGFPLSLHNVFFSRDYVREFRELLVERRVPTEPTVYVCAQDRGGPEGGSAGVRSGDDERLLVVVNAPATGDEKERWSEGERRRCEENTFSALKACGLDVRPTASVMRTPVELAQLYPATGGALYGPRPRGPLSALAREGARSSIRGLYFAGGSVHPGPGVPLSSWSGQLAAAMVRADLASTRRSSMAVIDGTTSMR